VNKVTFVWFPTEPGRGAAEEPCHGDLKHEVLLLGACECKKIHLIPLYLWWKILNCM